jgi:D-glycero-beta-D-manno-heptose 1-phosphate adenylyltransferase
LAIVSQSELILQRADWKRNGKSVVCVAGAFDLLHPGHTRLLEQARGLGDILVVGLQSDASVQANLGQARPVNPASERAEIVAALAAVDCVTEFDEPSLLEFVACLSPDIWVRGGQAASDREINCDNDIVTAKGGRVVSVPLEPGYSTSLLIERIVELQA